MNAQSAFGLCALFAMSVAAPADAAPSAWTSWGAITTYNEYGSGPVINLGAPSINPAGCSNSSGLYVPYHGLTTAERDMMGKALLAAFMSAQRVRVKIKGDTSANCHEGFPTYYGAEIEKP